MSYRTGNIFTRRYKQPKETNYRQIEKDILDEVMGPKVIIQDDGSWLKRLSSK